MIKHVWVLTRETPDGSDIMGIFTSAEQVLKDYPVLRLLKENVYTSRDFRDRWGSYYFLERHELDVLGLEL